MSLIDEIKKVINEKSKTDFENVMNIYIEKHISGKTYEYVNRVLIKEIFIDTDMKEDKLYYLNSEGGLSEIYVSSEGKIYYPTALLEYLNEKYCSGTDDVIDVFTDGFVDDIVTVKNVTRACQEYFRKRKIMQMIDDAYLENKVMKMED